MVFPPVCAVGFWETVSLSSPLYWLSLVGALTKNGKKKFDFHQESNDSSQPSSVNKPACVIAVKYEACLCCSVVNMYPHSPAVAAKGIDGYLRFRPVST